jgi:hypothetical protein
MNKSHDFIMNESHDFLMNKSHDFIMNESHDFLMNKSHDFIIYGITEIWIWYIKLILISSYIILLFLQCTNRKPFLLCLIFSSSVGFDDNKN